MGRVRIFDPSHDPGHDPGMAALQLLFWSCGASLRPWCWHSASAIEHHHQQPLWWACRWTWAVEWNMMKYVQSCQMRLKAAELQEESAHNVLQCCVWTSHAATPSESYFTGHPLAVQAPNSSGDLNWQWRSFMDDVPGENLGFSLPFFMWAEEGALCCKVSFFHLLM